MSTLYHRSGVAWARKGRADLVQFADDGFILGTTEPTWANSGSRIPQANLARNETTNLITSYDGQVISGLHLPYGRIELRHKGVTVRDVVGNIGYDASRLFIQQNALIVANPNYDTRGLNVEYVTCDPINAGAGGTADDAQVSGFYFVNGTFYRCAVRNVTDAFMPDINANSGSGPSTIIGNYVQTRWLAYDKEQTDGTHNDGVQLPGGDGHVIRGNSIHNPTPGVVDPASGQIVKGGQCVVFTPYHGALTNCVVDKNWLYGSYTQVSVWPHLSEGGPDCSGTTITGNRHNGTCVWPILITPQVNTSKVAISGNVAGPGGNTWNAGNATAAGAAAHIEIANASA